MFKPNEHTQDLYNRRPNVKKFSVEVQDLKHIFIGESLVCFETTDNIVEYSSNDGFIDVDTHCVENIYFTLHRKYIPFEEYM